MHINIVAGTFNDDGGKPSGWAKKLFSYLRELNSSELDPNSSTTITNGGSLDILQSAYDSINEESIVLWFADVPNDKPKLIKELKTRYPKVILVTSKRNLDDTYSFAELVSRALSLKSNLVIEITGTRDNVLSTVLDPLGNIFLYKESDIAKLSVILYDRLFILKNIKRISSKCIGEDIAVPQNEEITRFLEIVKNQADIFHNLIHGTNTTRMLGNASFRCERGFPSFKNDEMVFVSQRNVDKRSIGPEAFVAVQQGNNGVEYFGSNKPSVDTPIQLKLYQQYSNVRFMLHSHTYIENAPFTNSVIPCGAIEEASQIWEVFPWASATNFSINIKGHGSICFVDSLKYFDDIKWIARPAPEFI